MLNQTLWLSWEIWLEHEFVQRMTLNHHPILRKRAWQYHRCPLLRYDHFVQDFLERRLSQGWHVISQSGKWGAMWGKAIKWYSIPIFSCTLRSFEEVWLLLSGWDSNYSRIITRPCMYVPKTAKLPHMPLRLACRRSIRAACALLHTQYFLFQASNSSSIFFAVKMTSSASTVSTFLKVAAYSITWSWPNINWPMYFELYSTLWYDLNS